MNVFFRPVDDPRNRPGLFEFVCDVEGKPFAAMLNKALVTPFPDPAYPWIWTVQLACRDLDPAYEMPDEQEMDALNSFSIRLFETLHAKIDLLFVGTTAHRGNFEMMFLGRENDVAQIGGMLYALPEILQDSQGRLLQFKSDRDPEWEQLRGIYSVVRQYATPDEAH